MPALAVNIIIVHLGMLFSLRQALGENNFPLRLTNLDVSLHRGP
jgi:hypothetical protein